jgi:HSP20 family molecular chaperone IbpA
MKLFNIFSTTREDRVIVDIELPGVDPKNVKLSYGDRGELYINDVGAGVLVTGKYDLTKATAELKFGLLKVTIPEKKAVRAEIPVAVA